jgi:uncharacterized protein (TIGR02145 family)
MVENLKTTKYRNGDAIPNVSGSWTSLSTGAYSWYNNDGANKAVYGGYYNWYAVGDSRNIAPAGWHVPTEDEWNILTNYLGGANVAGGKLKEAGTAHWMSPNTGATNSTGFTALPGGIRNHYDGSFTGIGSSTFWWVGTELNAGWAWARILRNNNAAVEVNSGVKEFGLPVRCVRD